MVPARAVRRGVVVLEAENSGTINDLVAPVFASDDFSLLAANEGLQFKPIGQFLGRQAMVIAGVNPALPLGRV